MSHLGITRTTSQKSSAPVSRTSSMGGVTHASPKRFSKKPLIIAVANALSGHAGPVLAVSKGLVNAGYEVVVATGTSWKERVERAGATFAPFHGVADPPEAFPFPDIIVPFFSEGVSLYHSALDFFFLYPMVEQFFTIQQVLREHAEEQEAGRSVVMLAETMVPALLPFFCGASGLRPTAIITLGICPVIKYPGQTEAETVALSRVNPPKPPGDEIKARMEILRTLNATKPPLPLFDSAYCSADRFVHLSTPSMEVEHSDFKITFAGPPPMTLSDVSMMILPDWWSELKDKKVVLLTQGTVKIEYEKLLFPTLEALADRSDLFVIAVLGRKGATLEGFDVPANARIIDYFPYDLILSHASVFVTNGGFGGVQQSLAFGVPLVIAPDDTDKPVVAYRVAAAGAGIDFVTYEPSKQQIAEAVDKVLTTDSYTKRAREIEKEMKEHDCIKILDATIHEVIMEKKMQQEEEEV